MSKSKSPAPTVCLNMIVKNESHIIVSTLENLCSKIDFSYWVISDTGSTDNTKELIIEFFKKKGIKGDLVEHKWKDFGYNRSMALISAYNKSDYVLIFDADDKLIGDFRVPKDTSIDKYNLKIGKGSIEYVRPLLINNRLRWKFTGVLHEYLECADQVKTEKLLDGDYYIESNRLGSRSADPEKYLKDAKILQEAYYKEKDKNAFLSWRYAFYCAQSYKDCNKVNEAIEWYEKVLDLGNWVQEKYYSCIMLATLYEKKNDQLNKLKYLLKSDEYDPERTEGIILASDMLRKSGNNMLVNLLYKKYKNYDKDPKGKLFLMKDLYNYNLEYNASISSYYVKDLDSGYECVKKIILGGTAQYGIIHDAISNLHFYNEKISENDKSVMELFRKVDDFLYVSDKTDQNVSGNVYKGWNTLYEKVKSQLIAPKHYSFKNKKNPRILISFTTCKRFDLFEKTVYSILNNWTDVDKIDYWFCVDDNSSEKHRKSMRKQFSFIDYVFKDESNKGHVSSMNIIWNKLNELKPEYWIHMEDDFLFHHKTSYVTYSIETLKKLEGDGVRQVLFNRNYGETIADYGIKGAIKVPESKVCFPDVGIEIHNHKAGNKFDYRNCHYWPHYSFRPSVMCVKDILQLGDYTTENTFFEMDYAYRYAKKGYKSAFFSRMTNTHIGRLTSERHDKTKPNAYELNKVSQFGNAGENKDEDKLSSLKINEGVSSNKNKFPIKVINLERRPDRKERSEKILRNNGITDYEIIKAVDGKSLQPTKELYDIFKGNDFGNRKGVIGCALTHLFLWKRLLEDKVNDYYIVFEDDFELYKDFSTRIGFLKEHFSSKDFILLGYHMFDASRKKHFDKYHNQNTNKLVLSNLDRNVFIGGTFCYTVSKRGAGKMVDYIAKNGIKHGIDYYFKILHTLDCAEVQPHFVSSDWNEGGKEIDTDVQNTCDGFDFTEFKIDNKTTTETECKEAPKSPKKMGFYDNQLCERGSTLALYDYADQYEKLLGGESYIFYEENNRGNVKEVVDRFRNRFKHVYGLTQFSDVDNIIKKEGISNLYNIKYGLNDGKVTKACKNSIHCVFTCEEPHGEVYAAVSPYIKHIKNLPCVPHMINMDTTIKENLREKLGIPEDAVVYGRYGGVYQFDIPFVYNSVVKCADANKNAYFLFANTRIFTSTSRKNIIYLPKILDPADKAKFINTCDAMIHARSDGETFGLSVAEFSTMNKPVITTYSERDNAHLTLLGDKCIIYRNENELDKIFNEGKELFKKRTDWNAYRDYTPEKVMQVFKKVFIDETGTEPTLINKAKKRVKMICSWCDSKRLCDLWSIMCQDKDKYTWEDIEITWEDKNIDYYVIINSPKAGDYYDPKKTVVFQMEPWVKDEKKNWGVKTWGQWANPDPSKFMHVHTHRTHLNNVQWELYCTRLSDVEKKVECVKKSSVSVVCSKKNFDEGHILRNEFIRYVENKIGNKINLDVYGKENYHSFKSYRGGMKNDDKTESLWPYKYHFACENNSETNYATEKIWEPILCETLCFYWGCPNLENYIDSEAFVRLDLNDFEGSYNTVVKAIEEDWWSKKIDVIRREKKKILNELAFFPTLRKIIS